MYDSFSLHGLFSLIRLNSQELDEAKRAIADLEVDLKAERARLRVLTVEQTHAEREKENVLLQMRRTESDMEDVKLQLQRVKRNNNDLEGELRGVYCFTSLAPILHKSLSTANATAEQKARLLEVKSEENAETIEHLRQERSLLTAEHKKLQQRFKKALEVCTVDSRQRTGNIERCCTANGQAEGRTTSTSEISQRQASCA
jgi:myosin protein heavy chain